MIELVATQTEYRDIMRCAYEAGRGMVYQYGEVEIIIRPRSVIRSQEQNKAYWAMVGEFADAVGTGNQAVHEYLKEMFLGGKSISTSSLTKQEMADYMAKCQAHLDELRSRNASM